MSRAAAVAAGLVLLLAHGAPPGIAMRRPAAEAAAAVPGTTKGKIAFTRTQNGHQDIYTMNPDGSGPANLTQSELADFGPHWSPDGSRIAFTSLGPEKTASGTIDEDVFVIGSDGTGRTRLTTDPAVDFQPTWSPKGDRIAFTSDRDGNDDIYVMNADGSGVDRLTNDPGEDVSPDWSPDGTPIVFASNRDGDFEIMVMNADGSSATPLTADTNNDTDNDPVWSPDGTRIAFFSTRDGDPEVYAMNADGTNPTRLTSDSGTDVEPTWSPDGTQIAFVTTRDGGSEIWAMNADGTGQVPLTKGPNDDWPDWQPQG